ncbi:MAG: anaerobic glycerol-3-phosphate dehydrogenase subunit GlpB, partial [Candidatus Thorarchaeota archaeon]
GYLPEGSTPFVTPIEGLHALSSVYPFHPYAILGSSGLGLPTDIEKVITRVNASIEIIKTVLKNTPSSLIGSLEETINAVTILGTTKPTCLVQETMNPGDLEESTENVILFVGVKGLPDFNPAMAAASFLEHQISLESGMRKIAHASIPVLERSINVTSMEVARHLESDDTLSTFTSELKKHVDVTGATHVAMPPVLGLNTPQDIRNQIQKETGAYVFELLGFPPSVPGVRLQRSLDSAFIQSGGKLVVGHEVTKMTKENSVVTNVTAKSPRRQIKVDAKTFILASGKYIGGGITADEKGFREPLFGLPVVDAVRTPVTHTNPRHLSGVHAISSSGHKLISCGIGYDTKFRPLDFNGALFAENLFASGAILSGYNYATEKSGLGVSLVTGHATGENAASYVKEVSK